MNIIAIVVISALCVGVIQLLVVWLSLQMIRSSREKKLKDAVPVDIEIDGQTTPKAQLSPTPNMDQKDAHLSIDIEAQTLYSIEESPETKARSPVLPQWQRPEYLRVLAINPSQPIKDFAEERERIVDDIQRLAYAFGTTIDRVRVLVWFLMAIHGLAEGVNIPQRQKNELPPVEYSDLKYIRGIVF